MHSATDDDNEEDEFECDPAARASFGLGPSGSSAPIEEYEGSSGPSENDESSDGREAVPPVFVGSIWIGGARDDIARLPVALEAGESDFTNPPVAKRAEKRGREEDSEAETTHIRPSQFSCQYCPLVAATEHQLKVHIRTHTREKKPYKCELCGQGFAFSGGLRSHRKKHSGVLPHKCDVCGAAFLERWILSKHMRVHTGEKAYQCPTCGKRFSSATRMREHRQKHTGVKPHVCECGASFYTKSDLASHARVHEDREKEFQCNFCPFRTARRRYLGKHKKRMHGVVIGAPPS